MVNKMDIIYDVSLKRQILYNKYKKRIFFFSKPQKGDPIVPARKFATLLSCNLMKTFSCCSILRKGADCYIRERRERGEREGEGKRSKTV